MSTTSKKGRQIRRNSSSNTVTPSPRMFTATASINTSTVHSQFSSMFHACQESAMLSAEFQRRGQAGYEQKRHAEFQRYMLLGSPDRIPRLTNLPRQHLPSKISMTMEVQCSDFASLFDGREAWAGNDSIAVIMRDTRCMVQFANQHDEERTEKMGIFNQVTITADNIADLDGAMLRIRAFCPLTIAVPLINLKEEHAKKDPMALIRQWCQGEELRNFDRVQFSVLNPPLLFMTAQNGGDPNSQSLVIRASRKDSQLMVTASDVVCRLLFKEPRPTFYACLRIPASQRKMIAGSPDGVLIRTISTQTKAVIHYAHRSNKSPSSPSSPAAPTSTNYFLSGRAGDINQAIKALQDISPVRIEYEVENRHLARGPDVGIHREVDMFDIERAVIVQLRRSPYEGDFRLGQEEMRHSLTLMTSEENAQNLYQVRQNLLTDHFRKPEPAVKPQPNRRLPQYMEYLRVLVLESSMRAYIGEGRVVTVCRCNSNEHQHNHQQQKPAQANGGIKREEEEGGEEAGEEE